MFDPKTVSEMLQIPASTLRRYAKDWAEFLSESARAPGKKRRYTPEDITTLRRIRELLAQHKDREEIGAALQIVEDTPPETSALAVMPELLEELESIRSRFAQLEGEIESQRLDNQEMRQDNQDLQERVKRLEEWLLLPWWRRFGRKPPE